jgi:hypothetical protein
MRTTIDRLRFQLPSTGQRYLEFLLFKIKTTIQANIKIILKSRQRPTTNLTMSSLKDTRVQTEHRSNLSSYISSYRKWVKPKNLMHSPSHQLGLLKSKFMTSKNARTPSFNIETFCQMKRAQLLAAGVNAIEN